ncbi:unnamed protein product [Parajaminaea phylloscopi]
MATSFVPSQFVRLHNLLQRAATQQAGSSASSNEWYIAVDGLRNELTDLGKVKPMDEAEAKEIESGKITLGGTTHSLNSDFSSLSLVLASNLNLSPRYCASLLQAALSSRSRYPLRSPVEIALILYQRERWALTEAWKQLVTGAVTLTQENDAAQRKLGLKYSQAVQALLGLQVQVQDGGSKRSVSVTERLLTELDSLKAQAASVQSALRNPPANPSRRLPDEIQLERLSAIAQERRAWAHVLYLLCISSMLRGEDIIAIARWLSKVKENPDQGDREVLLPYTLTSLLSALETSSKASLDGVVGAGMPDLLDDRSSLSQLDNLINKATWATPSLQAVVQLQWSLLLVQVMRRDPSLGSELHVTEDAVGRSVLKAIQQGDAFVYIVVRLLAWKQKVVDALEGLEEEEGSVVPSPARLSGESTGEEQDVDVEFQPYLLSSLHSLLLGTTRTFLSLLRKLQRQEEDAAFSTSRSGSPAARRYDLEALLDGIALVVRGDESRSVSFWVSPDGRRSRFILWVVELREEGHQRALLDLLSAMASGGGEGAWQAHALLSSTQAETGIEDSLISWTRLWDWMAYYIDAFKPQQNPHQASSTGSSIGSIPPAEGALLRSFLRLLKSVVAGSLAAREAILAATLTNSAPSASQVVNPFGLPSSQAGAGTNVLQRLFALYVCPIPIELKASILDALAAFAKEGPVGSGASGRTARVRQELWALVESSGIIKPLGRSAQHQPSAFGLGGVSSSHVAGVRYELDQVEAPNGTYPGTISFLNFLSALVVSGPSNGGSRSPGGVDALVADLPSTSTTSGQVLADGQTPLGVPMSTSAAAQASATEYGLEKYLHFVVDVVLLPSVSSTSTREFSSVGEKWRLISAALYFLHRCLSAFDLGALSRPIDGPGGNGPRGAEDRETLFRLAMHPGFGVMKRLMSSSKLLHEIVTLLSPSVNGQAGIPSNAAGYEVVDSMSTRQSAVMLPAAVRTAMRIVLFALRHQDLFSQVLLPTLSTLAERSNSLAGGSDVRTGAREATGAGFPSGTDIASRLGQSTGYTAIDAKLLQEYQSVVQMALYVNSHCDDLAFLSVKLLAAIAESSAFSEVDRFADGIGGAGRRKMNRLVGLLEMTDESNRVREGVLRRLDALKGTSEENEAALAVTLFADEQSGDVEDAALSGAASPLNGSDSAICHAVLDLLLVNTESNKSGPNIAHLLLGLDLRATKAEEQVIPTPSPDSPRGLLHAILDLMRGEEDLTDDEADGETDRGMPTLLETHPALAEKSLALLLNLCKHPFTTATTLRYLRTQEDFWAAQIRSHYSAYTIPVERTPAQDHETGDSIAGAFAKGDLVFPNGRHLHTSVDALVASLKSRQHLLDGVALELHGLVVSGMQSQAARLVGALYGSSLVVVPRGDDLFAGDVSTSREEFDAGRASVADRNDAQMGMRLLGILQSLDFEWHDVRDGLAAQLSLLRDLDISQARAASSASPASPEYDISKTISLLAFARRELERLGELNDARRRGTFDQEAAIVLHHVSARNAQRAIAASRRGAATSWRNVQDLVLSHASLVFRPEARSTVIFDCLAAVLPRLDGPAPDEDPVLADLAAGSILSLLTSLRRHRASPGNVVPLSGDFADELPTDRLLMTLGALVGALLRSGTSVGARGNLYSALINYLQLVRSASSPADATIDDAASLVGGESADGSVIGGSVIDAPQASPLDLKTRAYLRQHAERLVPVIAKDALDAPDVWRTVAFTLLDKLCGLELLSLGANTARLPFTLDILSRGGYIRSFVARLRDMDMDLQDVLRPDPPSLNALYVYEAKMAFFSRLSRFSEGSHRLLEAKLFDVLAQADFLAAKPEHDQDFVDLESFLPAATERYGAMLLPALQLSVGVANSATSSHRARALVIGAGSHHRAGESQATHAALHQVLALLHAHREAFTAVLREAVQDTTSLVTIQQSQLVVALLLQTLPILDDEALTSPKPLHTYHNAILALAGAFLHTTSWRSRVVSFTESEREDEGVAAQDVARALATAAKGAEEDASYHNFASSAPLESAFDVAADHSVSQLLVAVVSYLEAASETFGRDPLQQGISGVRPCLTSSLSVPSPRTTDQRMPQHDAHDDYSTTFRRSEAPSSSGRLPAVPSLGIALASMDEQVALLEAELSTSDRIRSMLESSENVRLEQWDSIARTSVSAAGAGAEGILAEMSLGQRRALATRELRGELVRLRSRATQRLDTIDVLLVLIYRHFSYYLALAQQRQGGSGGPGEAPPTGVEWAGASMSFGPSSTTLRKTGRNGAGPLDTSTLINDGGQMVQMVLERLGRVLLSMQSAAHAHGSASSAARSTTQAAVSGVSNPKERSAFLELVGRKLQTLLLVRDGDDDDGDDEVSRRN